MLSAKIGYFRPTGFDPRSISGLAAWYDAADSSTLTISTGVSAWADKSGNGRTLTQEIQSGQPATGTRTIGGRNALDFDGVNDHLVSGFTIPDFTTSRAFTAFLVQSTDSVAATLLTQVWVDRPLSGDSSGWGIGRRTTRPEFTIGSGVLTTAASSAAYRRFEDSTTAATIYAASASASAGAAQMWKNSVEQNLTLWFGSLATANFLSQRSENHRIMVGAGSPIANSDAPEWYHDGMIGEVLIYSRALTAAEVFSVNRYLSDKWSIALPPQVSNADAQSWINRVYANGGTVSATTATAVNNFCNAIDAAGIRDRFYRLNLFAGTGLAAALVPLYRGQSLGGTQLGNATDTNTNFASGDYSESTGLLNATGTKFLSTGVTSSQLPAASGHVAWSFTSNSFSASGFAWGVSHTGTARTYNFISNAASQSVEVGSSAGLGFNFTQSAYGRWIGSRTSTSLQTFYRNGSGVASDTNARGATTGGTDQFLVFRAAGGGNSRLGMNYYGFGESMTAAQAASFDSAVSAFMTAMGRS